jgi:hypothetical protein
MTPIVILEYVISDHFESFHAFSSESSQNWASLLVFSDQSLADSGLRSPKVKNLLVKI